MEKKFTFKNAGLILVCITAFACKKTSPADEVLQQQAEATAITPRLTVNAIPAGAIRIVPDARAQSNPLKESSSEFACPFYDVLTGRSHTGDENGTTYYEYSSLKAIDATGNRLTGNITVEDVRWEPSFKESVAGAGFTAVVGRVITGRKHSGDENGQTAYQTGVIKFNGMATTINTDVTSTANVSESRIGWYRTGQFQLMTGRHHSGDENGPTNFTSATCVFDPNTPIPAPSNYRVIVRMNSRETYFPMNPIDFIHASRFREEVDGGADNGWSKSYGGFVEGSNSHNYPDNYDIPVSIINSYKTSSPSTVNLRPMDDKRDPNRHGVFLEPDNNLVGDLNPSGAVPVFRYPSLDGTKIQYWLFYGYDNAEISAGIGLSHQGDWENFIINKNSSGSLVSITLSQHTNSQTVPIAQVITSVTNNIPTITIYSAYGTHAMYPAIGNYNYGTDHCDNGYQYAVTDYALDLILQPWRDYAGAWGEVGIRKETTGPLGPWYKRSFAGPEPVKPPLPPVISLANNARITKSNSFSALK